jgi:hypothetical protein
MKKAIKNEDSLSAPEGEEDEDITLKESSTTHNIS